MSITAAALTGAVVGLRHSLEADHLAAISTLVNEDKTDRPGIVGLSWGVGHSVPILVAGLAFVAFGTALPESVALLFEVLAGLVLVYLGGRMLLEVAGAFDVERHSHGGHTHDHVTIGPVSIGSFHTHVDGESFLVGIVHGLAGSGIVVVTLAGTASTVASSLLLLASFAVITVLTMGALSLLWGNVLTTRLKSALKVVAGAASLGIGALLVATELFGVGPVLF